MSVTLHFQKAVVSSPPHHTFTNPYPHINNSIITAPRIEHKSQFENHHEGKGKNKEQIGFTRKCSVMSMEYADAWGNKDFREGDRDLRQASHASVVKTTYKE